jgi:hypothetical protein
MPSQSETMTTVRPNPTTVAQHLTGTAQSWHGKITDEGPFKPAKSRYRMYIGKLWSLSSDNRPQPRSDMSLQVYSAPLPTALTWCGI